MPDDVRAVTRRLTDAIRRHPCALDLAVPRVRKEMEEFSLDVQETPSCVWLTVEKHLYIVGHPWLEKLKRRK